MKFQYVSLLLAGLTTVVAQQEILNKLPQCAKDCKAGTVPDHCQEHDAKCACEDTKFMEETACCISQECTATQTKVVVKFFKELCSGVGVNNLPDSPTCPAGASSTSSSTSSSSDSTSTSAAETGGAALVRGKDASLIAAIGTAAFAFLA